MSTRMLMRLFLVAFVLGMVACSEDTVPTATEDAAGNPTSTSSEGMPGQNEHIDTAADGIEDDLGTPGDTDTITLAAFLGSASEQDGPSATAQEHTAIIAANQQLALALYHAYAQRSATANFAFAPVDVASTLGMVAVGAAGDTLAAVLAEFPIVLPASRQHPALSASLAEVEQRNALSGLQQHRALWGQGSSVQQAQASYLFATTFLDELASLYAPQMSAVDFTAPPLTPIYTAIDLWLTEHASDALASLLAFDSLTVRTRLVTASTLALDSLWDSPFDPANTEMGIFVLLDDRQQQVPIMSRTGAFGYVAGDGYEALEMPLAHGSLAALFILPAAGRFAELQAALTVERLQGIVAALTPTPLTVRMPVTGMTSDMSLAAVLETFTASGAFHEDSADFTGVNQIGTLFLDQLAHRTAISLQEQGPQAWGGTIAVYHTNRDNAGFEFFSSLGSIAQYAVISLCDVPQPPVLDPAFSLVRPFLLALRDRDTGLVLVLGQLLNPGGIALPPCLRILPTP